MLISNQKTVLILPLIMLSSKKILIVLITALTPLLIFAQLGPGGISEETPIANPPYTQSTCRLWYDASTLTSLADGDDLSTWNDISASEVNDQASVKSGYLPPYYRDNAANTINGYPVVTFEDGRFMQIGVDASSDINMSGVTNSKSVFVAFRTSTEISSKQIIYEEDGAWRGFNVYIENDSIFVGGHDFNRNGYIINSGAIETPCEDNNQTETDVDCTPQWGYTYVSKRIEANTTYILTAQYYAKDEGVIGNDPDDYYIKGWINGNSFGAMKTYTAYTLKYISDFGGERGVGTLSSHDNPIGLGAANSHFVDQNAVYEGEYSGQYSFQGRLAEYIYYIDLLNETQRIILENYLGAKYFANILPSNDKYEHQAYYGKEVIGIGQNTPVAGNNHNLSQGRNPFLISEKTIIPGASNHFFLTGQNGGNMTLTTDGVPENSLSIQRLERVWRVDETGSFGTIHLEIDESAIPAKPVGYSKLVLLVDGTSASFPNFTLPSTLVKEIPLKSPSTTLHQIDYDFPDNSFYTFAWLKPEVQFVESEASGLEADAPPTSPFSVNVKLNYEPFSSSPNGVDYIFVDGGQTAEPEDYTYIPSSTAHGITIPANQSTGTLQFDIVNDNIADDESTEQFLIILQSDVNTTVGIGQRDTLIFSILDDDPPPTGGFVSSSANISESAGEYYVKFRRTGDANDMNSTSSKIRIRRKASPNAGTATYNADYTLKTGDGWVNGVAARRQDYTFPAALVSSQLDSMRIEITDDYINEEDETINLTLEGLDGFAISPSSIINFTLNIIEDDPFPKANFLANNQTGYETYGDPSIAVQLDRKSTRNITVYYSIDDGASTATYNSDYTGTGVSEFGEIQFAAGDTVAYIGPFFVSADGVLDEGPETVIFNLESADNATIGTGTPLHTYTILDYAPFEWKGAAGIGQTSDNIVWMDAPKMPALGPLEYITNYSPRDIKVKTAVVTSGEASLIASGINSKQSIQFDGSTGSNADNYTTPDDPFINLSGAMERKSFFMVIRPTQVPSSKVSNNNTAATDTYARVIYEQGGAWRGMAIYLYNKRLYFHAWNGPDDEGQTPWGINAKVSSLTDTADAVYARSSQEIIAGNDYIISCHFDRNSNEPIMVYVNGVKGVMQVPATTTVGKLYLHNSITYGANTGSMLFHFSKNSPASSSKCAYKGLLSEFIMYYEPLMNVARRVIVENYLSAKYNIPLDNSDTPQVFDLSYADWSTSPDTDFSLDVCGVGQEVISGETYEHLDAQGADIMRVNNAQFSGTKAYMIWGHNNNVLVNTWPYSYWNADLPTGIEERSGKVWKIFENPNGSVSYADILINFSASTNATAFKADENLLKLLIHPGSDIDPQDFSGAVVIDAEAMLNGNVAYFKNVPITNGMYISLGNTSPMSMFPLPIELLYFNAKFEVDHVNLSWSTASELNNDYFQIERSGPDLNWKEILTTQGAGNSNTTQYYNEKDRDPLLGVSYYRLKQVDFDGNYKYSNVVSVINDNFDSGDEVFIYPNPVHGGSIILRIPYAMSDIKTTVTIYDLSGKRILEYVLQKGGKLSEINIAKLEPGAYLVQIHSTLLEETKKLIVN